MQYTHTDGPATKTTAPRTSPRPEWQRSWGSQYSTANRWRADRLKKEQAAWDAQGDGPDNQLDA